MASGKFSLSSLKIGDIAVDGGMSTTLTEIGINSVVRNTVLLSEADGTDTNFDLEIEDDPFLVVTEPGIKSLTGDLYLADGQQLIKMFGGTYTPAGTGPEVYEFPTESIQKEQSVELVHKNGSKLQAVRVKINATFEWNFKRDSLPLIHLKGTVLKPTKANTGPLKYIGAPVA